MTRINIVPVTELMDQHLIAEYREITMVPGSLNRTLSSKKGLDYQKISDEYTLNNGGAYTDAHYAAFGGLNPNGDGHTGRGSVVNEVLFDCTDVSNDKIRFSTTSIATNNYLYGETNASYSVVTFMRLGDT